MDELDRNLARADELIKMFATTDGSTGSRTSTLGASTGETDEASSAPVETISSGEPGSISSESDASSAGEPAPPRILAVDMPAEVSLAGPVPFTATIVHATSARARLDGVELGPLKLADVGVFAGEVPIRGSFDEGQHVLEVLAERGELSDARSVNFEVSTPTPGTPGWMVSGPAGSRARRLALTPEGDLIEATTQEIDGVARPVVRKRSALDGAELWPEKAIVLDEHEGTAEDVAVAPDGRMWVAFNVHVAANQWRPRIVLLDEDGHFTGIEAPTDVGQAVRGIDGDGDGGCFGVGTAMTGHGDTDLVMWRMSGDGVPMIGGKTWDYVPQGEIDSEHTYTDLASDVVVQDGIAWVVSTSIGSHGQWVMHARGLLARVDLDTGAVLAPVIVAPSTDAWSQSMFVGGAAHPDGVLVAGNGCNLACDTQRLEVSLYTAAGARAWFYAEEAASVAYASAVAYASHGVAVIAATRHEGKALRGTLLGRTVFDGMETFTAGLPAGAEDSELTGVVVDAYHRAFAAGYRTLGGVVEGRVLHVHQ